MKGVYDQTKVHSHDKLIRFDDGTYRYETSYGEAWDFNSDSEFVAWAEAEGMILDDEIKYQFCN